jgi:hypothetical protein
MLYWNRLMNNVRMWINEHVSHNTQPTPYEDGCTQLLSSMDRCKGFWIHQMPKFHKYNRLAFSTTRIGVIFSGCLPNVSLYKWNNYFEVLFKNQTWHGLFKQQIPHYNTVGHNTIIICIFSLLYTFSSSTVHRKARVLINIQHPHNV